MSTYIYFLIVKYVYKKYLYKKMKLFFANNLLRKINI